MSAEGHGQRPAPASATGQSGAPRTPNRLSLGSPKWAEFVLSWGCGVWLSGPDCSPEFFP